MKGLLPGVLAVSILVYPVLPMGPVVLRDVFLDWGDGYRKSGRQPCRESVQRSPALGSVLGLTFPAKMRV